MSNVGALKERMEENMKKKYLKKKELELKIDDHLVNYKIIRLKNGLKQTLLIQYSK